MQASPLAAAAIAMYWPLFSVSAHRQESASRSIRGTVALFSGSVEDLKSHWQKVDKSAATWKVESGVLRAGGGDIYTRQEFGDFQLHVEFKVPLMEGQTGQRRGNSGIKLHGRYEIQILDSYGKQTPGTGDCGALYQQAAPLINACKPPNEWQTFDITFRAPRLDSEGRIAEPARVTVVQNGITVLNNQTIQSPTGRRGGVAQSVSGPIRLQDHRAPVEFRNLWILPLPDEGAVDY